MDTDTYVVDFQITPEELVVRSDSSLRRFSLIEITAVNKIKEPEPEPEPEIYCCCLKK